MISNSQQKPTSSQKITQLSTHKFTTSQRNFFDTVMPLWLANDGPPLSYLCEPNSKDRVGSSKQFQAAAAASSAAAVSMAAIMFQWP